MMGNLDVAIFIVGFSVPMDDDVISVVEWSGKLGSLVGIMVLIEEECVSASLVGNIVFIEEECVSV